MSLVCVDKCMTTGASGAHACFFRKIVGVGRAAAERLRSGAPRRRAPKCGVQG